MCDVGGCAERRKLQYVSEVILQLGVIKVALTVAVSIDVLKFSLLF